MNDLGLLASASLLYRIQDGTLTADDWVIDGPRWMLEMKGRVTYYTHTLPSGNEVRVRRIERSGNEGYAAAEVLVMREGAVLDELSGGQAEPLVHAVRELCAPRVEQWRRESARDFE